MDPHLSFVRRFEIEGVFGIPRHQLVLHERLDFFHGAFPPPRISIRSPTAR